MGSAWLKTILWYEPEEISIGIAWSYDGIIIGMFEKVNIYDF